MKHFDDHEALTFHPLESVGDVNSTEAILTDAEAAWLAGFLDGEGSFGIKWQRSARDRHMTSTVATVCVSQAEPRTEILYWLKEKFGGSVANHGTDRRNKNHNASKRWAVTGARAVLVCQAVLPYLKLKRRHAEIVLAHQATKLSSHIGVRKGTPRDSLRITPEMIALRTDHVNEIAILNRRGVWQ